jgi:ankyrin repeat protein
MTSSEGRVECVRLLIQHGADVNVRDRGRWTPLRLALSLGCTAETVQLLVQHGPIADATAPDQMSEGSSDVEMTSASESDVSSEECSVWEVY